MKPMSEQQALSRLAALCSRGEHCEGEMREKLFRWNIDDDATERIIAYLISHKYIDDERFARAFAHDKLEYNGWGKRKIELSLRQKRVSADIISRVLGETEDNDFAERLRPLLAAKAKSLHAKDNRERTMKLIRFAMGRGFTYDQIKSCLPSAYEFDY